MTSAILGVAGALTSVNYALGGRQKVTDQLARMGTNVLTVTPEQSRSVGGRARTGALVTTLIPADAASIRREVPSISLASAVLIRTYLVKAGDLAKNNCAVVGIEPEYLQIKNWELRSGRPFESAEVRRMARVVLLGASAAADLFGVASPVGNRVLINRVPFEVIGVLSERGQSLDAANEDEQVYVPLTTAMHRLANLDYYSAVLLAVDRWDAMDDASAHVTETLRRRHRSIGKLPPDFQVQNQKSLLDAQMAASRQLLFFVQWIGIGALAMSGLGVLAIAWMGVRERTREIGTLRALGATRGDIFLQVLWESSVLSVTGCLLGLAVAGESANWLAGWAAQPRVFDSPSAWMAAGVAVTLNMSFAAIPAGGAARMDPIEALRFE